METLSSSDNDISRAADALAGGLLVAFPTETVYGLGGDAFNVNALAKIFHAKKRPFFDPLIIHITDKKTLDRIVLWEAMSGGAVEKFNLLTKAFWPGPLTLVVPKRPELPDLATSGLPTAGIRFPANEIAQKLIKMSTGAIAAPSANPFGGLSPTRAEHVARGLGGAVDFIINGGKTGVGLESTVLDITTEPCRLLRPGGISREQIESQIGPVESGSQANTELTQIPQVEANVSPGLLKSHYAPRTPLYLYKRGRLALIPLAQNEGRLYFDNQGKSSPNAEKSEALCENKTRILSQSGDPAEAAANFFDMLHELDSMGLECIRAEEAPGNGLGEAINDRLRRASTR